MPLQLCIEIDSYSPRILCLLPDFSNLLNYAANPTSHSPSSQLSTDIIIHPQMSNLSGRDIFSLAMAFIFPPISVRINGNQTATLYIIICTLKLIGSLTLEKVAISSGCCSGDFCINLLFCLLGFIPGQLHAIWNVFNQRHLRRSGYEDLDRPTERLVVGVPPGTTVVTIPSGRASPAAIVYQAAPQVTSPQVYPNVPSVPAGKQETAPPPYSPGS
jgi:uncharacterized membrane protein YqaE (UPF0057 family)